MSFISLITHHLYHERDHLEVVKTVPILPSLHHLPHQLLVHFTDELVVGVLQRVVEVVTENLQQVLVSLLQSSHLSDRFGVFNLARILCSGV